VARDVAGTKAQRDRREKAAKAKAAKEPKFIPMPKPFLDSCRTILGVARREAESRIALKIASVRELRAESPKPIPDDWGFDLERGGFVPPKGGG
jgi:hypothetical protein